MPPTLHLIAGPNGAGKTTFATELVPLSDAWPEFLNADMIAAGLSPFRPESQALRAGKLLLERLRELERERKSFALETTLAGRSHAQMIARLKHVGYRVELYFLWLPSEELAIARVASRVRQGGHDIPIAVIRRRFEAGLRHFFDLYTPLVDSWRLYDSRDTIPILVAHDSDGTIRIERPLEYDEICPRGSSATMATVSSEISGADPAAIAAHRVGVKLVRRALQTGETIVIWLNGQVCELNRIEIARLYSHLIDEAHPQGPLEP